MKVRKTILLSGLTFFMGMVSGFLLAPIKQGIINTAGSNTYNTYNYYGDEELDTLEDE